MTNFYFVLKESFRVNYSKEYYQTDSVKDESKIKKYIELIKTLGISLTDKIICDIGSANGDFLGLLESKNSCYGVELSEDAVRSSLKKYPSLNNRVKIHDITIHPFPFDISIDIITMFDVIEHLRNFIYLKDLIDKQLKSKGYLIITTPNSISLQKFILGNEKFNGEKDPTHVLLFTPYTLDFFLRRLNLVNGHIPVNSSDKKGQKRKLEK